MRKVDIGRQGLRDILVLGELQSVVIGDGMDLALRSIMSSDYTWCPLTIIVSPSQSPIRDF